MVIQLRCGASWVLSSLLVVACSSGSAGSVDGGSGAFAGSGGDHAGVSGGNGLGGLGGATASAGAGGVSTGNAGSGGAISANAGAPSGGTAGSSGAGVGGASGGSGGGGASGGSKNCAGNAISLSANGTGAASDAARARVEIDLMSDLPIGNASRTVEFWAYIKPSDWIGEKNEVYVYGSPSSANMTNTAFGLDFGTNPVTGMPDNHATLNPYTNGSFTVDSQDYLGISSSANQWVHIAMTWDGSAFKTYVNGELGITKTDGTTELATASTVLTMGCNPPINNCFNGYFDELRVWNVARAAVDIKGSYDKSLTGSEAGLVGYWKFDESPGAATAADSATGGGHTAHAGKLLAASAGSEPTFVTPSPPAPIVCP